jgi:hypothetical protein
MEGLFIQECCCENVRQLEQGSMEECRKVGVHPRSGSLLTTHGKGCQVLRGQHTIDQFVQNT